MLASALSGHPLQVAAGEPGSMAWTDGKTVFVDPDAGPDSQLEQVAVQAVLLAAGSLEAGIVRRLGRRRALAARYLALEGHRSLALSREVLPPALWPLIDRDLADRTDSAAASLALAGSRAAIGDPPAVFGTIRPRRLLAAGSDGAATRTAGAHAPRRQHSELAELDDGDTGADDVVDIFSSPVGGSGALGRLVAKLLSPVRRLSGAGSPGADAATHRTRSGALGGAASVVSTVVLDTERADIAAGAGGTKYPEWDVHRRRYRRDWCTVQEEAPSCAGGEPPPISGDHGLRRPLTRLAVGLDRCRRQAQGDDVDIDAAVEARTETIAGSPPDEAVYLDSLRRRRDLSVLVLLDISGSTAEPGAIGQTVHQQQRAAAAALTAALHDLGDRVALYAFCSRGRAAVQVAPVKRFDDALDVRAMRRLYGLSPGAYSRLGAAIRHGTAVLESRGGTPRRLLVVLSDGLAYDDGYERFYGAADARRALAETRRRGIGCLCLTIGAATDVEELRRVFGSAAYATIPRLDQLNRIIGPLFRSALRSAEMQRRVA
ncbi:MAG TPA: VWA domain-containing protein [Mycobacterium sp.]|nr:VWA domain-containing protein [Mycobacterium sp.]